MAAHQMIDILRWSEQFHEDLSAYYASLRNGAEREQVRQLLEYLSRHERCLELCFKEYEATAPRAVSDAWFKNLPDLKHPDLTTHAGLQPDMSVDEVLQLALRMDDTLIEIYQHIANTVVTTELRESVEAILEMEREEERIMVRQTQGVNDL